MLCKSCHYSLANLAGRRCPECGTPFNPNDPGTYVIITPEARRRSFAALRSEVVYLVVLLSLVGCALLLRPDTRGILGEPVTIIGVIIVALANALLVFFKWQKHRSEHPPE